MTQQGDGGLPDLRVLGPVEIVGPDGPAALVGARQRAVIAALALHPGTMLPFSRLVDAVWGEDPPRTAVKTLHSHVARIRQALTAGGLPQLVLTREPGYVLAAPRHAVDAHQFIAGVERGRALRAGGALDEAAVQLRAAVALWRGDALADAPVEGWAAGEVDRLHELRLSAFEELYDIEVRIGRHHEVMGAVSGLLAEHPSRERLTGIHMLALYRAGRQTDALDAYQRLRHRLADDLGVDPGPELSGLHLAILRRDPALDSPAPKPIPAAVVPAQLPARVGHFTGRDEELQALEAVSAADDDLPVVVVCGPAGMGKTSLAVQWAHTATSRFPDGQLFLDLRGHDPKSALSAEDALTHVLRGLDVPDDRMPSSPAEQAALYRTLLHGKRFLVVLDNACRADDVLPLVPGGRNLLVVTSRNSLAALSTRHAMRVIAVDALGHDAAVALLGSVLGADRVAREPGPAARLARLCGGMPLALRIAAARLIGHPKRPIAEFAAELNSAGRLDNLAVEGDTRTVRTVLASAYSPLSEEPARLFRRLGLHPGPTFSTHLGAAVCGVARSVGGQAIDELSTAHLVTAVAADRYRFHDLTRVFARQCATADEPDDVGERLLDWYLLVAHQANQLINPARDVVTPSIRYPDAVVPFGDDQRAAIAFLDAERDNFLPVVQHARETGRPRQAWELTYLLTSFYEATGHWHERIELCRQGAAAACDLGDPLAEGEMLRALGVAFYMSRRLDDALETNMRALAVVERGGDLAGQGHVYNNIGNAYAELRRFDEAVAALRLAVSRCADAGNRLGRALSLRNLGRTYIRMGQADLSVEPLNDALAQLRDLGNRRLEAGTLDTLGEAYLQRGQHDRAITEFTAALAISREIGDRWLEWEILHDLGVAHLDRGAVAAALAALEAALAITREVGGRHGEAMALDSVGRAYLHAGDLERADQHLTLAVAARARVPDVFAEAHLHRDLGDLAARRADSAAATRHWDRAMRLYQQANATAEAAELATRRT
ncbi:DNA-binding transcriptional activator of the SARP family [Actinokineospora alba]|uniref:DNA-binding transcriptional activator of the SARP family n=1 Tax=Actinokineospora alba TaxID=504798 RepID=A0A1H0VBI8_9PSEU|nr:BTAD domain-containing putative transcriptional regulator [Actinokineospora alba]TDP65596.1 DNA-binding SARP family transcriptional activator [Actinokineospora alba]SDH66310.1 DNA-binding transcriptional activator of the SARP family [Actinokineospora alba]SDP75605.1 DNA-binding transcriptional activator of the SARP family [Actinokineospora alba]